MDALQATAMDLDDAAEAPPDPLEVAFEAAANASDPGAAYLAVLTDAERECHRPPRSSSGIPEKS